MSFWNKKFISPKIAPQAQRLLPDMDFPGRLFVEKFHFRLWLVKEKKGKRKWDTSTSHHMDYHPRCWHPFILEDIFLAWFQKK